MSDAEIAEQVRAALRTTGPVIPDRERMRQQLWQSMDVRTRHIMTKGRGDAGSFRHAMLGRAVRHAHVGMAAAIMSVIALLAVLAGTWHVRTTRETQRIVYVTRAAERKTITLHDGTHVILAPETRLTLASTFGQTDRTVALVGEASFDVATARGVPFVVRTGHVSTQVLGTQFGVRAYPDDHTTQVIVHSGKVMTRVRGAARVLAAGEAIDVTDSAAVVVPLTDLRQYADVANGELVFRHTQLPIILAAVGRWYGYHFQVADSTLLAKELTVTLKTADRTGTLADIQAFLDVTMTFEGNIITLTPRRRSSTTLFRHDQLQPVREAGR